MARKLKPAMQEAAVRAELKEGSTLAEIKERYGKELSDGIARVESETSGPPVAVRSGSTSAWSSMNRPPTI